MSDVTHPSVSAVIATRGRPDLLRQAVRAILKQDYSGAIEVIVVYDQVPVDPLSDVEVPPNRRLATTSNVRSAGLAGGRNTGILAASGHFLAFCDDDDAWMPAKLTRQVAAWSRDPDARMVASGIRIVTDTSAHERLPPETAGFDDLLRSRITEMHPSSFLFRRDDLLDIGMVDEDLPASYGEDYDLLLRATRGGHVRNVVEPLVTVHWDRASFFSGKWAGIAAGLTYLLDKYPQFASEPGGSARIEGQIAFAHAALGERRQARSWAARAIRHDWRQLRAYAAIAVASGIAPPARLVRLVNRAGRGL